MRERVGAVIGLVRRHWRTAATVCALAVALLGAAGGGFMVWIQTTAGHAWVADLLGTLLSAPGQTVFVGALDGVLPWSPVLSAVELRDGDGVWLRAGQVRLEVDRWSLFAGRLDVTQALADRVELVRPPAAPRPAAGPVADAAGAARATSGQARPDRPVLATPFPVPLLPLTVTRLRIEELVLGEAVLAGESARLRVEGSARLGERDGLVLADLALARTDGRAGDARIHVSFAPEVQRLELDAALVEPAGGVVARALDLRGLPALELSLIGVGPLQDWRGRLRATAAGKPILAGEATVRAEPDGYRFETALEGDPSHVLQPPLAALTGPKLRLTAVGVAEPAGRVTLRAFQAVSAAGTASAFGWIDGRGGGMDLRFDGTLAAEAWGRSGLLPAGGRWRQAAVKGSLSGSPQAPVLAAELTGEQLEVTGASIHGATARLRGAWKRGMWDWTLEGVLDHLVSTDPTLARLSGPKMSWNAAGLFDPPAGELRLNRLNAAVAAGRLEIGGVAQVRGPGFQGKWHFVVNNLARLAGPLGLPVAGVAELEGRLRFDRQGLRVDLGGTLKTLQTGDPLVDQVLEVLTAEGGVGVGGLLTLEPGGALAVNDFKAENRWLRLTGRGRLAAERIEALAKLEVPELATLAEPVAAGVAGSLYGEFMVSGRAAQPEVKAVLRSADLGVQGRKLGRAELDAAFSGLPAHAKAGLRLRLEPVPATGRAAVPLLATATAGKDAAGVNLTGISLAMGSNRASGALRLSADGRTLTGRLVGVLPELSVLQGLSQLPLRGQGRLELGLEARGGRQVLTLGGEARGLRWGGGREGAEVQAAEGELRGEWSAAELAALAGGRGRLELTLRELAAGGAVWSRFSLGAEGEAAALGLRISATGQAKEPLELDLAGTLEPGAGPALRLGRASFRFAEQTLALEQPATLVLGEKPELRGFELVGGGVRVAAEGQLAGATPSAKLQIRRLPLAWLRLALPELPASGRLDGEISLAGSLADPRGEIAATLSDLASGGVSGLGAAVKGHWQGGRLRLEGTLDQLKAQGEMPLALTLAPLGLDLPAGARIRGELSGRFDLSRLNDWLAANGDRLSGSAEVAGAVGGTLAEPRLEGAVTLEGGRYENLLAGTVIEALAARVTGNGRDFVVERLSGRAGSEGRISGTGRIRLLPGPGEPMVDLHLLAQAAPLVQRDGLTADLDADLTLRGGPAEARLSGTVTARRATIRLPDQLPPQVVDLQARDVTPQAREGSSPPAETPPPREAAAASQPRVDAEGNPLPARKPALEGPARKPAPAPPVRKPGPGAARKRAARPPAKPGAPPPQVLPAAPMGPAGLVLALRVVAESQIFVRGRGLDAEFACALTVEGSAARPRVQGSLTMQHGQLDLLGKPFQFKRGAIEFVDSGELNPALDMLAEARATGITAQIAVAGTAARPKLTLTSVPMLPPDEVLARVLFDKPTAQLTPLEAVQLADSAAQLVGLGGSAGVVEKIRRSLGVDRLGFTGGSTNTPGRQNSAFEAGRYLSRQVYLGVEQGVSGDAASRAKLEVGVTENLQLEAGIGVAAEPKVGLKFEWDY